MGFGNKPPSYEKISCTGRKGCLVWPHTGLARGLCNGFSVGCFETDDAGANCVQDWSGLTATLYRMVRQQLWLVKCSHKCLLLCNVRWGRLGPVTPHTIREWCIGLGFGLACALPLGKFSQAT